MAEIYGKNVEDFTNQLTVIYDNCSPIPMKPINSTGMYYFHPCAILSQNMPWFPLYTSQHMLNICLTHSEAELE